jgi:hypothetical protein
MRIIIIIAAVLTIAILPAAAQQPIIDFSAPITGLDGKPVMEVDANGKITDKPVTLGAAVAQAAMANLAEDKDAKPLDLFRLRQLGARLYESKQVTLTTASECKRNPSDLLPSGPTSCLTVPDRDKLKERVAKVWGGIVQYRAWLMLDPALAD